MSKDNIHPFYPAARQPATMSVALASTGQYSSPQSARPVILREPDFEVIEVGVMTGYYQDKAGQIHEVVIRGLVVERTPAKYLKQEIIKMKQNNDIMTPAEWLEYYREVYKDPSFLDDISYEDIEEAMQVYARHVAMNTRHRAAEIVMEEHPLGATEVHRSIMNMPLLDVYPDGESGE